MGLQIGNTLRRDGHEVLLGNDAQSGLNRWGSDKPDLMVVEHELPGPSGLQLAARIRQTEPRDSHTPIVLIGGSAEVDAKVTALRNGADDYRPVVRQERPPRPRDHGPAAGPRRAADARAQPRQRVHRNQQQERRERVAPIRWHSRSSTTTARRSARSTRARRSWSAARLGHRARGQRVCRLVDQKVQPEVGSAPAWRASI